MDWSRFQSGRGGRSRFLLATQRKVKTSLTWLQFDTVCDLSFGDSYCCDKKQGGSNQAQQTDSFLRNSASCFEKSAEMRLVCKPTCHLKDKTTFLVELFFYKCILWHLFCQ